MTNKKAIEILRSIRVYDIYPKSASEETKQALDLAIKALGERSHGEWIPEEETYTDLSGTIETYTRFKCDNCMQGQNFGPYPFCPWCGKKMNPEIRKETKDEDVN